MSENENEQPGADGRESARIEYSLQGYVDTLSQVILASRMVHGVTVAVSVRNPNALPGADDAVIMASNTSIGGPKPMQLDYGVIHMKTLEHNAGKAVAELEQAQEGGKGGAKN